ncbi:MAG: DUF542 domain-containing protein [Gemmatimonadaceae bacterium]
MTETTITGAWSVNDTIRRHPESIAVFNQVGIDSCCGGAASLADSAREVGIELDDLLNMLNAAIETGSSVAS